MPFAEDFNEVFDFAIKPAAEAAGFDCRRADHAVASWAINAEIVEGIFLADVIVADLTGSNANVFYEVGIAHTIDNKTILICEETGKPLPFDLAAYKVIFYRKGINGIQEVLRNRLEAALKQLNSWKKRSTNPVQDFRPVRYAVPIQSQKLLEKSIAELKQKIRTLNKENRLNQLRALIYSLRDVEFRHLRNLNKEGPFTYKKQQTFVDELRKLRSLKLIRNKTATPLGDIPAEGDLKDYVELTELTREVLEQIFLWVEG